MFLGNVSFDRFYWMNILNIGIELDTGGTICFTIPLIIVLYYNFKNPNTIELSMY